MNPQQYMRAWAYLVHSGPLLLSKLSVELEAELGVSALEHEFLTQIKRGRGEIRMTDLAENLWVSKAGVTKVVDRLEASGLVERSPSPEDRRVIVVGLTPAGEDLFASSRRLLRAFARTHFASRLTVREIERLETILEKLLKTQEEWETLERRLSPRGGSPSPEAPP